MTEMIWFARATAHRMGMATAPIAAAMALALCTAPGCDAAMADDTAASESALTHPHHGNPNPQLFEPDSRPFGIAMDSWAEEWWRWDFSIPKDSNPSVNATEDCDQHQHGPVFFVPTFPAGTVSERSCTIRHRAAIAMSLSTVVNEFPCPDPTFLPAPGQSLFDFLVAGAKGPQDALTEIAVSLDGVPLNNLMDYRVTSNRLMLITGDLSLQVLDSCILGKPQPAAVDAFFIVFKRLEPGPHVVTTRTVSNTGKVRGPLTYHLDIR